MDDEEDAPGIPTSTAAKGGLAAAVMAAPPPPAVEKPKPWEGRNMSITYSATKPVKANGRTPEPYMMVPSY